MGKPRLFVIKLAGNKSVYYAGSDVEGSVSLELSEPEQLQGISIVFSGKAYVQWDQGSGQQRVRVRDAQIIFHDMFEQLWGNGKDTQELAAGRYEFPFKFQLPSDRVLPSSFESDTAYIKGYIRYLLQATIKRSWKFNHTTSAAIPVSEIVNINTRQLTVPLSRSSEKTLCCFCCASGPISLSATTDRGGYCLGESIAISAEAENHSKRRITCLRATLKQMVVYRAGANNMLRFNTIQRVETNGLSNWNNKLLTIPTTTLPAIYSCRVINLSHVLTVTLAIPNAVDLHVTIPITVGNVPFRSGDSATGDTSTYPASQNLRSAPSDPYPPPPPFHVEGTAQENGRQD